MSSYFALIVRSSLLLLRIKFPMKHNVESCKCGRQGFLELACMHTKNVMWFRKMVTETVKLMHIYFLICLSLEVRQDRRVNLG